MTTMIVPQEVVDSQLAQCKDGETADFTIKGGNFKLVPGVGAVVSGDTITKSGYAPAPEVPPETPPAMEKKMSPAAMAVVGRKGAY